MRRSVNETLHYLKEKSEAQQSLMREEMTLKVKQQEADANRHHEFVEMMRHERDTQQNNMQVIQTMLAQQMEQKQNQLFLELLDKVASKQ